MYLFSLHFFVPHYYLSKWRFFCLVNDNVGLTIMLTIELKMVSVFWARRPISFKHMLFWCLFLDPHQSTFHSNIGVHLIVVLKLGTCTLQPHNTTRKLTTGAQVIISITCWEWDCKTRKKSVGENEAYVTPYVIKTIQEYYHNCLWHWTLTS